MDARATLRINIYLRVFAFALYLIFSKPVRAQEFKVLHYTETSGFNHQTRNHSLLMFQSLAMAYNFSVDNDTDGTAFNSLSTLQQYAVVIFSNTSGDEILDSIQKINFEAYMNSGGSFLGIHAASDTYRHSSANGTNTGKWDWYAEMLGASVQQNPNHVNGTPSYAMAHTNPHASTVNVPNPWQKNEEYYYWEAGYYNSGNIDVLEVEQTLGPNMQVNSYDSTRPMSWYKILPSGGKSFYTALGHSADNFSNDQNFINHVRDGLLWLADITNSAPNTFEEEPVLYIQNISPGSITINLKIPKSGFIRLDIFAASGKIVYEGNKQFIHKDVLERVEIEGLQCGAYLCKLQCAGKSLVKSFIIAATGN